MFNIDTIATFGMLLTFFACAEYKCGRTWHGHAHGGAQGGCAQHRHGYALQLPQKYKLRGKCPVTNTNFATSQIRKEKNK
jgi:hypothetical protein